MQPLYAHAPHPCLQAILSLLSIEHDNSLASLVEQTQHTLLRNKNQERWDVDTHIFKNKRTQLMTHLRALGFVDAIAPQPGSYEYLVIFGFVSLDISNHIKYLCSFLPSITFKHAVILTSSLPLPDCVNSLQGSTEAEAMEYAYQQSALSQYPYTLINVAMLPDRRPNTEDTVLAWLATNPQPGRCLALSGNPFIRRQTQILQQTLPCAFAVTPCGPQAEKDFPVALYLDELARALYQEARGGINRP